MEAIIDGAKVTSNSELGDIFVENMILFSNRNAILKDKFIQILRNDGFKCCHPNDGWVDRENNEIYLAYSYFNDGLDIGELLMIAYNPTCTNNGEIRPVKIIDKIKRVIGSGFNYKFEDIKIKKSEEMKEFIESLKSTSQKRGLKR